jgi:hypothetical protein
MEIHTSSDGQLEICPLQAILRQMAEFEVFAARHEEIVEAQALAARLIGPDIAPPEILRRVHESTGIGVFVAREDSAVIGVLAFVPLTAEGLAAVRSDAFNGLDPADGHIAMRGSDLVGLYAWGVATAYPRAARRLAAAYDAMVKLAIPQLPVFARPATLLGERLLIRRMNFKPYPGSATRLVWIAPYAEREPVAA